MCSLKRDRENNISREWKGWVMGSVKALGRGFRFYLST